MYDIVQTTSKMIIKELLTIDNTYDNLVYDHSPSLEEFDPNVNSNVWFILMHEGYTAGIAMLEYLNYVLWVPHIIIFEQYRGNGSEEWGKLVADHMRIKYGTKKFLAITPYIQAKKYAEKVGFKQIAILENSIQKNGILMNQFMLEMS